MAIENFFRVNCQRSTPASLVHLRPQRLPVPYANRKSDVDANGCLSFDHLNKNDMSHRVPGRNSTLKTNNLIVSNPRKCKFHYLRQGLLLLLLVRHIPHWKIKWPTVDIGQPYSNENCFLLSFLNVRDKAGTKHRRELLVNWRYKFLHFLFLGRRHRNQLQPLDTVVLS